MSGRTSPTPDERRARDSARGKRVHDALLARFEREVDPEGVLDPAERARLAEQARTAHFRRIGQKGAAASAQSKNAQRRTRRAPAPGTTRRPDARAPDPADWAQLWDQPAIRAVLSARDISRVYRVLKDAGVTQRQIAELTGQSQPEVSDICNGRQVRDVTVLERICDGLVIPRPLMRLLDQAPGQNSAYSEEEVTDPAEEAEVLRRDLLAQGSMVLVGAPVLGTLIGPGAGAGQGPGPLPSQVGMADVAEIATTTEQLRSAARAQGGQARAVTAAALEYGRLRQVPAASEAVATALGARLAELTELAGWCWHDSGDDHRARWLFHQAAGLARQAGDQIRVASVLRTAAHIEAVRDNPENALKFDQLALEILRTEREADPQTVAELHCSMADDFVAMGRTDKAIEHLNCARDGWAPATPYAAADMDYGCALVQVKLGRFEVAEALVARVTGGGWWRPVGVMAGVLRATIHVQTGEPRGLVMANEAIRAVVPLRSVRARQKLVPLVQALDARPGSDAQALARMARQVAT